MKKRDPLPEESKLGAGGRLRIISSRPAKMRWRKSGKYGTTIGHRRNKETSGDNQEWKGRGVNDCRHMRKKKPREKISFLRMGRRKDLRARVNGGLSSLGIEKIAGRKVAILSQTEGKKRHRDR